MDIRMVFKILGLILLLVAAIPGDRFHGFGAGWFGLFLWFLAELI